MAWRGTRTRQVRKCVGPTSDRYVTLANFERLKVAFGLLRSARLPISIGILCDGGHGKGVCERECCAQAVRINPSPSSLAVIKCHLLSFFVLSFRWGGTCGTRNAYESGMGVDGCGGRWEEEGWGGGELKLTIDTSRSPNPQPLICAAVASWPGSRPRPASSGSRTRSSSRRSRPGRMWTSARPSLRTSW